MKIAKACDFFVPMLGYGMAQRKKRPAATLSISLTPELAAEVSSRVESGLYTSASELIRCALRLLLQSETVSYVAETPLSVQRFESASRLMEAGRELQARKAAQGGGDEVLARLRALAEEQEVGPGLRLAPERLRRLKLDGPG